MLNFINRIKSEANQTRYGRLEYNTIICWGIISSTIPLVTIILSPILLVVLLYTIISSFVLMLLGFYQCRDCRKIKFGHGHLYYKDHIEEHKKCDGCCISEKLSNM